MTAPHDVFRPAWSFRTPGAPRGLALARERGFAFLWDEAQWLTLLDAKGERQAQKRAAWPVAAGAAAEDGSAYAAAGGPGTVSWLAPDLSERWTKTLSRPPVAVALDPFGGYLAASDAGGKVTLFDRDGGKVWETATPRPLHHLAFVPEAPLLVGAADFGFLACLDARGQVAWRDGLAVHVGGLASSGDGGRVVLACFSDGLRRYTAGGARKGQTNVGEPCRLTALSFDGKTTLVAGRATRLLLLDGQGTMVGLHLLDAPAAAVALAALGERALAAQADGRVVALDLRGTA